jgi:hypothetical protein
MPAKPSKSPTIERKSAAASQSQGSPPKQGTGRITASPTASPSRVLRGAATSTRTGSRSPIKAAGVQTASTPKLMDTRPPAPLNVSEPQLIMVDEAEENSSNMRNTASDSVSMAANRQETRAAAMAREGERQVCPQTRTIFILILGGKLAFDQSRPIDVQESIVTCTRSRIAPSYLHAMIL